MIAREHLDQNAVAHFLGITLAALREIDPADLPFIESEGGVRYYFGPDVDDYLIEVEGI